MCPQKQKDLAFLTIGSHFRPPAILWVNVRIKQPLSGQEIVWSYQGQSAWNKSKIDLMCILEFSLQDLNLLEYSDTRPTKARELIMLTFASPSDFDLDSITLRWLLPQGCGVFPIVPASPFRICIPPYLKTTSFVVWGDTALEKILGVLLHFLQTKFCLFLLFWLGGVFWLDTHQEANSRSSSNNMYHCGFSWASGGLVPLA